MWGGRVARLLFRGVSRGAGSAEGVVHLLLSLAVHVWNLLSDEPVEYLRLPDVGYEQSDHVRIRRLACSSITWRVKVSIW